MDFQVNTPDKLIAMIAEDEGFKSLPYVDTEGHLTIGMGFNLDTIPMPKTVGLYWCGVILDNLQYRLSSSPAVGQTFNRLCKQRRWAILNMAYQMGVAGVSRFLDMWKCLDNADYEGAAAAALDSLWHKQTPKRAERIAKIIRTGRIEGYGF